jgi:hypothetical protein
MARETEMAQNVADPVLPRPSLYDRLGGAVRQTGRVLQRSKTETLQKKLRRTQSVHEAVYGALVTSGHDGRKGNRLLVRIEVKCRLEQ